MAIQLSELQQMLDDLKRETYSGQRSVRFDNGQEVVYGSMDDMRKAIADLQGEIDVASSSTAPTSFSLSTYCRD